MGSDTCLQRNRLAGHKVHSLCSWGACQAVDLAADKCGLGWRSGERNGAIEGRSGLFAPPKFLQKGAGSPVEILVAV